MSSPASSAPAEAAPTRRSRLDEFEIDMRLLGMIGAFLLVCLAFWVVTDGKFLSARNIFNLTIQTASVAVMATGMVFIIVCRHIDLSVGAVLALSSAVMGVMQVSILPNIMGLGLGHPLIAPLTMIAGLATGTLIGAFNGWLVGYQRIPAFIVTLGGLLVWRYVSWYLTAGQTIAPLDPTFLLFGGAEGTLGATASWVIGLLGTAGALWIMLRTRQGRAKHGFHVRPAAIEGILMAIVAAAILGFVAILNSYQVPTAKLKRLFEARGEVMPEGYSEGYGLPISVLMLIVVAIAMTVVARRTRFGRYIFATGGNPDAAELSGINTKALTVKIFALMGFLCGLSAIIAQARLQSHPNDIGSLDELRVIAAAVIGGTALSGGVGTIYGAILGALVMQSLQSGMAMVGADAPLQNIVVGVVLVLAVWLDIQYRKRMGMRA